GGVATASIMRAPSVRGHPACRRRARSPHRSLPPSVPQVPPVRNGGCLAPPGGLPRHREAWTRSVCPLAAARPSRRGPWSLEPCPRQALGFRVWEAAVDDHDRNALRPGLTLGRRHREDLSSRRGCTPPAPRQPPRRPGVADVLAPPIRCRWEHRHPLPPQRSLAGELAPLLLPGGIRVEGEAQLSHLPCPLPAPALHAKDRHHTRHARGEQRQGIKSALA